jgi:hypothetical protein
MLFGLQQGCKHNLHSYKTKISCMSQTWCEGGKKLHHTWQESESTMLANNTLSSVGIIYNIRVTKHITATMSVYVCMNIGALVRVHFWPAVGRKRPKRPRKKCMSVYLCTQQKNAVGGIIGDNYCNSSLRKATASHNKLVLSQSWNSNSFGLASQAKWYSKSTRNIS